MLFQFSWYGWKVTTRLKEAGGWGCSFDDDFDDDEDDEQRTLLRAIGLCATEFDPFRILDRESRAIRSKVMRRIASCKNCTRFRRM